MQLATPPEVNPTLFSTSTVLGLVFFVFLVNALLHREPLESLLFALALTVGLTPGFLPMVMTVTLGQGAMRMARAVTIGPNEIVADDFYIRCGAETGWKSNPGRASRDAIS